MSRVESGVEGERPALTEPAKDDPLARDPGADLGLDEAVHIRRGRLHPGLVLRPVGVEGLEVEPGGHHHAGVEGDRHLVGAGAHELDAAGLDAGDLRRPAVARVPEAVEEDDGGRVLGDGGYILHYGILRGIMRTFSGIFYVVFGRILCQVVRNIDTQKIYLANQHRPPESIRIENTEHVDVSTWVPLLQMRIPERRRAP